MDRGNGILRIIDLLSINDPPQNDILISSREREPLNLSIAGK